MRELRSGKIVDVDGNEIEFWFYEKRTVGQHLEIEQLAEKHGETQTALLLSVFLVCALDSEGKRLYSSTAFKDLANKFLQEDLVSACLTLGGVQEEAPDPKG